MRKFGLRSGKFSNKLGGGVVFLRVICNMQSLEFHTNDRINPLALASYIQVLSHLPILAISQEVMLVVFLEYFIYCEICSENIILNMR